MYSVQAFVGCFVCLTLILQQSVFGANILAVTLAPSPSHHLFFKAISLELIKNGHNITMLSHDNEKVPIKNLTIIHIEGIYELLHEQFELGEDALDDTFLDYLLLLFNYFHSSVEYDVVNGTKQLRTILEYPKDFKFDLIIWDVTSHQAMYPLIDILGNPPVVSVSPYGIQPYHNFYGYHHFSSYRPVSPLQYNSDMTFFQRLYNSLCYSATELYKEYVHMPAEEACAKKFFGPNIRPLKEIEKDFAGILLINNDPILDFPQSLPPNVISIGGMQAGPSKPLDKDFLTIMENAKHGVILFSLGTNVPAEQLDPKKLNMFLAAFSKLKQTVIWKFKNKLENVPKNVILRNWVPQNDVLGHPNTKLFISHAGALSTHETIYHGVPVVCLPFFADQIGNSKRITERKLGRTLHFHNLSVDYVLQEIGEVVNNPMYRDNIKLYSKRVRDQPQTPLNRATFWIEYALRHGNVKHLIPASKDMPFYKIYLLDVLLFAIVSISVILFVLWNVIKCIASLIRAPSKKHKQS